MKKKVLASLLVSAMAVSMLAGCGDGNTDSETGAADTSATSGSTTTTDDSVITIWVTENAVSVTEDLAEAFLEENELTDTYSVKVEPVGEGDAATNMITDVTAGADIYTFAQDQLSRLVAAGAIQELNDEMSTWVAENNSAGTVTSVKVGDKTYAFPTTEDNGYFLYYNKAVISDPTSWEAIIADCQANGMNAYVDLDSAWYNAGFFFATGCTCEFEYDDNGNCVGVTTDYASANGVAAMKEMIALWESGVVVDSSSVGEADAEHLGVIVDGNWDASAAQEALGDNYAATKLPTFTVDGTTYQTNSFSGCKMTGVKPQSDATKLAVCYALAQYLTNYDAQMARFNDENLQWGPSNTQAQSEVSTEALEALIAQNEYSIPQGNYPGDWWSLAGALGGDIESGTITSASSDDDIMALLQTHDDTCATYVTE